MELATEEEQLEKEEEEEERNVKRDTRKSCPESVGTREQRSRRGEEVRQEQFM